jgi:hypothetical protein
LTLVHLLTDALVTVEHLLNEALLLTLMYLLPEALVFL